MKKFRFFAAAIMTALLFLSACGEKDIKMFNPETDSPYLVADKVKSGLLWDSAALFAADPKPEPVEGVNPGRGMKAVKFESVPYSPKGLDHTYPFAVIGMPDASAYPKPEGGYSAVVLVHGGAGQVYPKWVKYWNDRGFVAIAIDVFGNELDSSLNKVVNADGGPNEGQSGSVNDGPGDEDYGDSWVYHSVANIIFANNILRAMPEVNNTRIGVTGISWGGVLTCIASGVDKRFAAFAPVYGAGYLYDDSFQGNTGIFGGRPGTEGRSLWIDRYDPSSYLPYAVRPMLFVSGVADNCFSVTNRAKSMNLVPGKVFSSQRSDLEHGYYWEQTYEIYPFFEHIFENKDTVIRVTESVVTGSEVSFQILNPSLVDQVNLIYTTDSASDSHSWRFKTTAVTPAGDGTVRATLPEGTTAFAFECVASSIDLNYRMGTRPVILAD